MRQNYRLRSLLVMLVACLFATDAGATSAAESSVPQVETQVKILASSELGTQFWEKWCVSSDGKLLAGIANDARLVVWNLETGKICGTIVGDRLPEGWGELRYARGAIAFSKDGHNLHLTNWVDLSNFSGKGGHSAIAVAQVDLRGLFAEKPFAPRIAKVPGTDNSGTKRIKLEPSLVTINAMPIAISANGESAIAFDLLSANVTKTVRNLTRIALEAPYCECLLYKLSNQQSAKSVSLQLGESYEVDGEKRNIVQVSTAVSNDGQELVAFIHSMVFDDARKGLAAPSVKSKLQFVSLASGKITRELKLEIDPADQKYKDKINFGVDDSGELRLSEDGKTAAYFGGPTCRLFDSVVVIHAETAKSLLIRDPSWNIDSPYVGGCLSRHGNRLFTAQVLPGKRNGLIKAWTTVDGKTESQISTDLPCRVIGTDHTGKNLIVAVVSGSRVRSFGLVNQASEK